MKKIITLLGLFLVAFVPMTMAQIITITNVTSSKADGSYISGNIDITLTLAEPITTTSLVLGLALNNTAVVPLSVSDGTTSTLAFTYTIGAGEDTPDLETTGLTITSGSSEDGSAVPTTSFVLPTAGATGSLSKNKNLLIDTTVPTVSSVTSTNADDTCKVGSIIYVAVNFSEKVKVTGIPKIKLNTGAVDAYAYYTGGNNTNKLSFKYTVQVADTAIPELNYDATNSLELNSGTIKDYAGNNATLTLFSTAHANSLGGSKDIEIDGIRPAISTFAASGTDPAHAGDIITITIVFTQNVKITGAPRILLETGKTDHYATFVSGSGTKTLVFEYLVVAGDETSDLNAKSATALSGGTFKDEVGNDAVITLPALTGTILVDASAPKVTNVTSTKLNGTYKVGEIIPITITFDQAVTVTGTPQLTLDTINAVAPVVNYTSGSASNTLTFNYTVGATYNTADLSYAATNSLALNSGTIKDANNNNAVLTLANIGATGSLNRNKAIVIDNTNATVVSVRSTTVDGTYKIGSTVYVNVNFTEKVKVTGSPKIELETGTTNQFALYNGGNNSTKLTFKYIVQAGDTTPDLDYVATTSLILNGGFIKDYVGNDATLTLAVTGTGNSLGGSKAIEIDGIRPTISSFTTSGSNPANAGDNLTIKVIYDQPVLITGSPKILLETGKTDRYATYVSGSGTDTLVFNYLVVSGDETAILREKSASALTSGTFKDPNGNEAVITLPALSGGF